MISPSPEAKRLFLEAVEHCAPDEWDAYLQRVCGDDVSLRDAVSRLLRGHAHYDPLLDEGLVASEFEVRTDADCDEHEHIGPYQLHERLGEGGMGIVYRAVQETPVSREVALKVIKPGMDTEQVLARFERERQTLSLMEHPHIARVLDGGTTDSGHPYFVMELVRGLPLTTYCRDFRLNLVDRLQLFIRVCQAVQHAHQRGVIHRDLKPSNVLVAAVDDQPLPKVIDFGIAKALEPAPGEQTVVTAAATVMGTLLYASPEQIRGQTEAVDTRSDVYSLGALLYELLAGEPPFTKQHWQELGYDAFCNRVCNTVPEHPSARRRQFHKSTGSENSSVAGGSVLFEALPRARRAELDWIVMKALEKDPDRRYSSAHAMAADIHRYLRKEPVEACPPSTVYRFRKFASRHRTALSAAVIVLLSLIGAVAVSTRMALRARHAEADARDLLAVAQSERERVQRLLYAADVRIAAQALDENDVRQAVQLLNRNRPAPGEVDLRGTEWHYLMARARQNAATVRLTDAALYTATVSPDGRLLAAAGADSVAWFVDAATMTVVGAVPTGQGEINGLSFSPDGSRLASMGDDGTVAIWETSQRGLGSLLKRFPYGDDKAYAAVFSSDTTRLFVCGAQPEIRVFDTASGTLLETLTGHRRAVESIALSPNGRYLASGASDCFARFWDAHTGKSLQKSADCGTRVSTVTFTPDGRYVVFGDVNGGLYFSSGEAFEPVRRFHLSAAVQSLAVSPDGLSLAVGTRDGVIRVFDRESPEAVFACDAGPVRIWQAHESRVYSLVWISDHELVSASQDGQLKRWPTTRGHSTARSGRDLLLKADSLTTSPDGRYVFLTSPDKLTISQLDTQSGQLTPLKGIPSDAPWHAVTVSPSGAELVAGSQDGRLVIANLRESAAPRVHRLQPPQNVHRLRFSSNGRRLLVQSFRDERVAVLDWPTLEPLLERQAPSAYSAAISSDGESVALNESRDVHVYDVASGRLLAESIGHHGESIVDLAFTPDGQTLATCGDDRQIKVWTWRSANAPELVGVHAAGKAAELAISSDGNTLISCSRGGEITLWSIPARQKLFDLARSEEGYRRLALSANDRLLVARRNDLCVQLFWLAPP